jgi:hypothetical protein
LHQQVELAFVVDCAPKPELPARDHQGHLIEMPTSTLAEDADGEVLGRIEGRTSRPIVAPFRRRHPDRAPRVNPRRRDS